MAISVKIALMKPVTGLALQIRFFIISPIAMIPPSKQTNAIVGLLNSEC